MDKIADRAGVYLSNYTLVRKQPFVSLPVSIQLNVAKVIQLWSRRTILAAESCLSATKSTIHGVDDPNSLD